MESNSKYFTNPNLEIYDFLIEMGSFYKDKIIRKNSNYIKFLENKINLPFISIIGNEKCGKTFFLSELSGVNFPTEIETPSICAYFPKTNDSDIFLNSVLLDTKGYQIPEKMVNSFKKRYKMVLNFIL